MTNQHTHPASLWPDRDGQPLAIPFIGGAAYEAQGDLSGLPISDPATGERVGTCVTSDVVGVDDAVAAAVAAASEWAVAPPAERAEAMRKGAERIEAHIDSLVKALISEVGKAGFECTSDVRGGLYLLRSFADSAPSIGEVTDLTGKAGTGLADEVLLHRVPIGPVGVITPWNSPIYLTMNCVAPALIAGCPVVVKPAEAAPLAVTAALRLLSEELPPGVLSVVQGRGVEVGTALCSHPDVRAVSFVGGIAAGSAVLKAAAENIKKTSLELGGNDAAIVLEDADLSVDHLREIVAGAYCMSGQLCFNIKRIYVHRSKYTDFVERFTALVDELVVGPGSDPSVHVGPMTTAAGHNNALRLLNEAEDVGATVHVGGRFAASAVPEKGQYILPTVVTDIPRDHELVLEEQFAPIIPIIPFDDDDDAIAEANRTEYGLCSSVWSADPDHARAVAMRVEAGNTFINAHRVGASVPLVPFGGMKRSGLGRNHLEYAIAECTEEHAVIRYSAASEQIPGIEPWQTIGAQR